MIKIIIKKWKRMIYEIDKENEYPKFISNSFVDKIKGYNNLKQTHRINLKNPPQFCNGKRVKYWKVVRINDDNSLLDEYIPIYFK
jgi:hypothetical protein